MSSSALSWIATSMMCVSKHIHSAEPNKAIIANVLYQFRRPAAWSYFDTQGKRALQVFIMRHFNQCRKMITTSSDETNNTIDLKQRSNKLNHVIKAARTNAYVIYLIKFDKLSPGLTIMDRFYLHNAYGNCSKVVPRLNIDSK